MEIVSVDKKLIRKFVDFPDELYRDDACYVPYMKADLTRTLKKLLLEEKSYTALLALDDGGRVLARVLFTVARNKQLNTEKCGFFSMYECVEDDTVSHAILSRMRELLAAQGAEYISGTYFPYDQDNRRGIMVQGFDRAPLIFTSYNPPYYNDQMVRFGFEKDADTYEYTMRRCEENERRIEKVSAFALKRCKVHIDRVDFQNIDRDVHDFQSVMQVATNEIIYQDAPTEEALKAILKEWKSFLNRDFILIARRDADNAPVGILMAIPDYFQVFRKMRGKTDLRGLLTMALERKKIRAVRGMLQYVIPEYQNKGVIAALYCAFMHMVDKHGVDYIEAGTIMENNDASNSAIRAIGGELSRIYRIYTMKLGKGGTE
ncbi:MAG: hypothetical protein KBS74_07850 [Clostridiales bacterium]|nr:hypothetical protein [Candidatus Cacconaster stercorequi]